MVVVSPLRQTWFKYTLTESKKATLRRLNEIRSTWLFPRSRSTSRSSTAKGQASWTTPTLVPFASSQVSLKSARSVKKGSVDFDLEESKSTFDLPMDMAILVDEETPFGAGDASYSTPLIKTAPTNGRIKKLVPVAEALDDPASTSTDVGLRLLLEAISGPGEMFRCMDTQVFSEATLSMDLTLGQTPSFLDDICKRL